LGLPERLRTATHQQNIIREGTVARATVFEAYIGGLLLAGTTRAEVLAFIEAIFAPIIHHEYEFLAAAAGKTSGMAHAMLSFH
jgi:hypothetical protein